MSQHRPRRPSFTFMTHALERYQQRYAPTLSQAECTERLKTGACNARRLRERTRSGEEIWSGEVDGVRVDFVVKRDGPGRGYAICVTVLPPGGAHTYVNEVRASVPTVADPATEALRRAVRFVASEAHRGQAEAAVLLEELTQIAPWSVRPSFIGEAAGGPHRDSDGCIDVAVVAQREDAR